MYEYNSLPGIILGVMLTRFNGLGMKLTYGKTYEKVKDLKSKYSNVS